MGKGIWDLVTPGFSYRLREAVKVAGRLNWGRREISDWVMQPGSIRRVPGRL